ncbi:MAG: polyhydroxyalkanoic acid system family protein [Planctomycetota bacterium]
MPSLTVAVPHTLDQQEATQRLRVQTGNVKDRFGGQVADLAEEWDGDVLNFGFTTFGVKVQGTVTSGESQVEVALQLPYAAMLLRGAIEKQIRGELEKTLA